MYTVSNIVNIKLLLLRVAYSTSHVHMRL